MSSGPAAAQAYDRTAASWLDGPEKAYARFAAAMVALAPEDWRGAVVVDLAAGTGTVGQALRDVGARPVAVDAAPAMVALARGRVVGMPAAAGDVLALPLRDGCVAGATAGFCINHLAEPHRLLEEAARTTRRDGVVLASTYAEGDDHPAKDVVNGIATAYGWQPSPWYAALKEASALTDTPERLAACAGRAGLHDVEVVPLLVESGVTTAQDLVAWRLGMPELAGFIGTLPPARAAELRRESESALGDSPPPLVRRILVLRARAASG